VRGRRTALADVTLVRSDFLCLDDIDSVLSHICRHEDEPHALSASLTLPCHSYWLEQMKANIHPEALRFKRAAFYNGLKSKVGLAATKAAALRINLNVQGCSIVAPPMHAPSRTPRKKKKYLNKLLQETKKYLQE
jgi:hypothetical protein